LYHKCDTKNVFSPVKSVIQTLHNCITNKKKLIYQILHTIMEKNV